MGVPEDVREDYRHGRSDARRAMESRRLSTSTVMKLRLSLFWPAALAMVVAGLLVWRMGHRPIAVVLAAALAAGLVTLAVFALLLEVLLKRARLAEAVEAEAGSQALSGPARTI